MEVTTVEEVKRNGGFGSNHVYIGRSPNYGGTGVLGNDWTHKPLKWSMAKYHVATVEEAIAHYRVWLHFRIQLQDDEQVLRALAGIGPRSILVCHCKPGPCHGDVIVKAIEHLEETKPQWWVALREEELHIAK
ncbi:MAG TPA: DUF4326 domain-containing protein [Chloroflexia bacterium]|jgi:hypothetical protein